ncbi:hypothetical protein chiPu_0027647, partial [Chiloscyllium punctatum]|nr:hypothetical protein [Chiloscyllium punctatum]
KSSAKESTTKLPVSEQSLVSQVLADSSLPVTPVTPVTPTLPVTPTSPPISTDGNKAPTTSAPELVKSGQRSVFTGTLKFHMKTVLALVLASSFLGTCSAVHNGQFPCKR